SDADIYATIYDYGVPSRNKPELGRATHQELRSGEITLRGKRIPVASLSSYLKAREITNVLKNWIKEGKFFLTESVEKLPLDRVVKTLEIVQKEI
ncbi:MAG: homocysteine biosynthesis protein, partial [Candidatus Subteraquimicrobiales bacterium]|nr:homocysteine biosynthesis protein [Candidatus Subteraquimicrobiales bacterium]